MNKKILTIIESIRSINTTDKYDIEIAHEILKIIPEDADYTVDYYEGFGDEAEQIWIVFDEDHEYSIAIYEGQIYIDEEPIEDFN